MDIQQKRVPFKWRIRPLSTNSSFSLYPTEPIQFPSLLSSE